MTKSYSYTPPNSTSGWWDGELKFFYNTGVSVGEYHIHELFASSSENLTGKIDIMLVTQLRLIQFSCINLNLVSAMRQKLEAMNRTYLATEIVLQTRLKTY